MSVCQLLPFCNIPNLQIWTSVLASCRRKASAFDNCLTLQQDAYSAYGDRISSIAEEKSNLQQEVNDAKRILARGQSQVKMTDNDITSNRQARDMALEALHAAEEKLAHSSEVRNGLTSTLRMQIPAGRRGQISSL